MRNFKTKIFKPSSIVNNVKQLLLREYSLSLRMQQDVDLNRTTWDLLKIFRCPTNYKYAVVILNTPFQWKQFLLRTWEKAQINITVDGGTDRWFYYLKEQGIDPLDASHTTYVPDIITGDMDSCSTVTLEKFRTLGSTVIKTPDQDYTDYTKALSYLGQYIKKENINLNSVYVFVDSSGRFDHIMGNINTLYKSDKLIEQVPIIQIASDSLTWLLKPGFHSITIPNILVQNKCWCGLLPIGAPVNCITTTGLKWNLNNATLKFGGVVSTSNTYDNSQVTINTVSPVIWTMGTEPLKEYMNNNGTSSLDASYP